jgi:O-antigen/teichoic acid export membrane protein
MELARTMPVRVLTEALVGNVALPRHPRTHRGLVGRAGWTFADQALSSLGNFVVAIAIARSVSPSEFGAFAVVFMLYLILLQFSQAISTEPLVVRFSASPVSEWHSAVKSSTGAALTLGVIAAVGTAIVALFLGGVLGSTLLALAVALPGLLLQDAWRFAFFAKGSPARAAVNDFVWTGIQILVIFALLIEGRPSITALVLAWGGSATTAALVGVFQARVIPDPTRIFVWLRAHSDLAPRYVAEFVVFRASKLLTFYIVGIIAGLAALGTLRAAIVLVGPVTFIFTGSVLFAVPEAARLRKSSLTEFRRMILLLSVTLTGIALVCGACVAALPDSIGSWMLGDTWPSVKAILVPVVLSMAGSAALVGPWTALRALGAAAASLRVGWATAVNTAVAGSVGALAADLYGAAAGLALASWVSAYVWWREYSRVMGLEVSANAEPPVPETEALPV